MKKLLTLLTLSAFSSACYAAAADWTPLLQSMKKGCAVDFDALPYGKAAIGKLPAQYRASVARSRSRQTESDGEALTIELKNSVAFGQPLSALIIR